MLGGSSMSRSCRHVHPTASTTTTATWSGRRVLSTAVLGSRISTSDSCTSTQLRPSTGLPLIQWLPSLRSRPNLTAPMSTSKKPPSPPSAAPRTTQVDETSKAPTTGPKFVYPERLIIYHAGTGKIVFLASLKLTTIFSFALFDLWAFPTFVSGAASIYQSLGIALCGLIPLTYVAYTTTPYVTTIHMYIPQFARVSAANLERFAKGVPPATKLEISTLSFIGKPRTSTLTVGDLKPTRKRWGMVNYERDTTAANAERKWWRFRAVGEFNIQGATEKKLPRSGWAWRIVNEVVGKRSGGGAPREKGTQTKK
ncbi:hypothetical protein V8F33_007218 [Rhypophila sp. PSN 637]